MAFGNFGDAKPVGDGVSVILLLLCGGDKSTQRKDIERARSLARDFEG